MRRLLAFVAVSFLVTACATSFEAPRDARISTAPDAPGYVVVGLASQTYKREFGRATEGLALGFARAGGTPVTASRYGCGSVRGFYGSKPCDLGKVERQVLAVPAGDWTTAAVVEQFNNWGTRKLLRDQVPSGSPIHVGPGEVVYVGDFTFASDYDAQEIKLVAHGRDDAGAAQALAEYPGLQSAAVVYRDPTARK